MLISCSPLFAGASGPETAEQVRKARAERQLRENQRHQERAAREITREELPEMDAALVDRYQEMVEFLSDPAREGRVPGSLGIEQAAVFIEDRFAELGLSPAFDVKTTGADGEDEIRVGVSYRQSMQMGVTTSAAATRLTIDGVGLVHGKDYSVLSYSGSDDLSAPVTFAGYAVVSGPGRYMGFENSTSLEGRIALCLNYEPMDEDGRSLWRDEGWSHHSRLSYKVSALSRRNAAAVMIVSPPGADDERVDLLETIESTAPANTGMGMGRAPKFDIPVIMVTAEVAEMILFAGEDPGATLEDLVAESNSGGVVRHLGEKPVELMVEIARTPMMTDNVGAVLEGRGDLKDEVVVIGAHYDHIGYGKFGSRIASNVGKLHPGADDNASGTAGMMLAAQMIKDQYALLGEDDSARSVLFLAFTAEESGLNGSKWYVEHPIAAIDDHALMLNMDMIGRLEDEPLEIGGLNSAPGLEGFVETHFEQSGLAIVTESSVGEGRSDHASFDDELVPALFLFTGLHDDYHAPGDTPDLIDFDGGVRIAVLCSQIGLDAATTGERFVHRRQSKGEQANKQPTVRVGILPSNSAEGGMVIERVFPETSASDAGLREQDRIVSWDGEELESIERWRPTLLEVSPGDVVTLTVDRGGEIIEIEMTLRAIE